MSVRYHDDPGDCPHDPANECPYCGDPGDYYQHGQESRRSGMALITVFVYTADIDNTSAAEIQDALNQSGFTAEDVCVRPLADMPEKLPLVTADGHIYHHNANCCRGCGT